MSKEILEKYAKTLRVNGFDAYITKTSEEAKRLFFGELLPQIAPKSISWGGSGTLEAIGVIDALPEHFSGEVIDGTGRLGALTPEQKLENRRQALLCDLYLSGTNAVSEKGELVNLDGIGNRVAALSFGPKHVVVFAGVNKLCSSLESAMCRVKHVAAILNAKRFPTRRIPCLKDSLCHDCKSPDSICNVWSIINESYPAGRIKVVLIDEELGF